MTASRPVFEVIEPGFLTTVQDAGRRGHRHAGVPLAGAADPVGMPVANRLAGADVGSAALECTLLGPRLAVLHDVRIGVAGSDLGAVAEPAGRRLLPGRSYRLRAGERIAFDASHVGSATGCRAYLAVEGGIDVPLVLGSRSTSLVGGFGGLGGRPLRAGDVVRAFGAAPCLGATAPATDRPPDGGLRLAGEAVRALPGPNIGQDPERSRALLAAFRALISSEWTASTDSDRRGVRLLGPPIPAVEPAEAGSHGVTPGAVQLTPSGLPLVLLADAGPTGGYPVIGVVASADLGLVGQARPGARLRFEAVDLASARGAAAMLRQWLEGHAAPA